MSVQVALISNKLINAFYPGFTLLEEKVLYRTLKSSKALRIWNP